MIYLQYDIREAPLDIRDAYKLYYKLKTSFLEEALSDALDEDSFDLSLLETSSQTDSRLSGSFSELSTPDVSALTSVTSIILQNSKSDSRFSFNSSNSMRQDHERSKTDFEAEATSSLNDNAWVGVAKTESTTANSNSSKLRNSMSDKLFRNSSFIKRNPRKSLSRSSFTSSQSSQLSSSQKESLPDLETILSQKSQKQKEIEENTKPQTDAKPVNIVNNFDEEWLSRCHMANSIDKESAISKSEDQRKSTAEGAKTFGISNINANALASYEQMQQDVALKTTISLDMNNMTLTSKNSIVGNTNAEQVHDQVVHDDDEIANSEDESDMNATRQFRSIRFSSKRKRHEMDQDIPMKVAATNSNVTATEPIPANNNLNEARAKPAVKIARKPSSNQLKAENLSRQTATRKSSRNINNKKTYTDQTAVDLKSDEEVDPFAGDDSDKDPNFSTSESKSKQVEMSSSEDEKPAMAEEVKPVRKRVSRVKAEPKTKVKTEAKPRVKAVLRAKLTRKVANKKAATNCDSSNDEQPPEETPDNYLPEFGMENIQIKPRIPVAELEKNTKEFSKYVYSSTTATKGEAANKVDKDTPVPLTTKNSIAKQRLEKKIASGSLNENFVRLNLRKKVFVRGKKTMNFSRYKKKLWKSQKAAALSGPDMDMGGCDGGLLTCFQCGLPGHFAQNCKVKSK